MHDSISVVIPAYNEESRIRPTLEKVHAYCADRFGESEIIVVDDGSSDNTSTLVADIAGSLENIHLIACQKNAGKGHAVRKGVLASRGGLVLISDADLSTPLEELERLVPFIHSSYDIVIGSRGLRESRIIERQPWYREGMGRVFNIFVRMIIIRDIKDTQCGFKLFKGDIARDLFSKSCIDGFSFDVEVLYLAKKAGYKIKEAPVQWINSPFSRVELISDPLKMFFELLKVRVNALAGKYNQPNKNLKEMFCIEKDPDDRDIKL